MPADRLLHPKCGHSHKVSMLTDLEFRVWIQCLLSSDDFGVMLDTPARLQADNRHLLNRPTKTLRRCLDALVACGLLRRFEHQGQAFLYSHNWQSWQKVEYPRTTDMPKIPDGALEACDEATRALQEKHPGGMRRDRRGTNDPNDSERASQTIPEQPPPTGAPAKRLTANGLGERRTANGAARERFDRWWRVYPRRIGKDAAWREWQKRSPSDDLTDAMIRAVTAQKTSADWLKEGGQFIPHPRTWLHQGRWQDECDPAPTRVMSDAAAEVFRVLGGPK